MQRGFIGGRSMVANIIDVDHEAQMVALTQEGGALVLFDFAAAFLSLDHHFLLRTLEVAGLPPALLSYVRTLYSSNECHIHLGGRRWAGFALTAVSIDILLRRIHRLHLKVLVRAFADDIALVVPQWWAVASGLARLFSDFAGIAGLELNLPKTLLIPLWVEDLTAVRINIARRVPSWAALSVETYGTYLGMVVGPGSPGRSWSKPLAKFRERVQHLAEQGLGLYAAINGYHIFAQSVLLFVAQLEELPASAIAAEEWAFGRLMPGPGAWILPWEARHLDLLGFPCTFRSLAHVAVAAKARLMRYENSAHGGLQLSQSARDLDKAEADTVYIVRQGVWASWFARSFPRKLKEAVRNLEDTGLPRAVVDDIILGNAPRPHTASQVCIVRQSFQRRIAFELRVRARPCMEPRLRHKIGRWHPPLFPRLAVGRLNTLFGRLNKLVPPRVVAACIRTLYNGWMTQRRLQQRGHCRFACVGEEDSIEHYACCPVVRNFGCRRLQLEDVVEARPTRIARFVSLGVWLGYPSEAELARRAVLVYAVYRAVLLHRHAIAPSESFAAEALPQFAREAVRHHRRRND